MSSRPLDPDRFRELPAPIDLDATIVSVDVDLRPDGPDDGIDAWLLKNAAG